MTEPRASDRDVSRAIRSWLHEARHEDASGVAGAVLDRLEATPQRRATWWRAWRMPFMSKLIPIGLGAAAVVVALVVGAQLLAAPAPEDVGEAPSVQPSAVPSSTPSTSPSDSPATAPPPLSQTFTSTQHGISLSYPEGWTARAATEPWTDRPGEPQFPHPGFDVIHDPVQGDHLFLYIASQPIGDSTPEDWVAAQLASDGCSPAEPIAVDGATGLIAAHDCDDFVAVTSGGRGYWIGLHTSDDDPVVVAPYDRAWFEEVLATVQLRPEDAVDVAP